MIKAVPKPRRDGAKRKADRCTECGHPLKEHRPSACTVPLCRCLAAIPVIVT